MKILILVLLTSFLWGDLEDHLKPAPNKEGNHSIPNIDFIYMINLDQRPEKWKLSLDQLQPYGIIPYRFSAVNGWELSLETINDVGLKYGPQMDGGFMATSYHLKDNFISSHEKIENIGQTYFCHCMARGTIGIALSHVSVLQDAYESGYKTIWVMEDDIQVIRDPNVLSELIIKLDQLIPDWDLFFTDRDIKGANGEYVPAASAARRPDFSGPNQYALKENISTDFRIIGARYGAHSMIIRRSGIKKLLQFMKAHQIFFPYDMEYTLPPGIKLVTVLEDVVSNLPKALTDNGAPNYLQKRVIP